MTLSHPLCAFFSTVWLSCRLVEGEDLQYIISHRSLWKLQQGPGGVALFHRTVARIFSQILQVARLPCTCC